MKESFAFRLMHAFEALLDAFLLLLPGFFAGVLTVLIGLVVAFLVSGIVRRMLEAARFDRLCAAWGLSQTLTHADVRAAPSALAARLLAWLILASFGMAALAALEVRVVDQLIAEFFLYLPRLLAALAILIGGFLLGSFLARAALLAAVNADAPSPRSIALVVKLLITILSFAMALEQLQIAKNIVLAAFVISFGAVMLCLAIAFGVGGSDVARRVLARQFRLDTRKQGDDEISHV